MIRIEPLGRRHERGVRSPAATPSSTSGFAFGRGQDEKRNVARVFVAVDDELGVVGLADLVFKALPDDAVADLKREGYDARTFWERLKQTGPAEILTIEGDDGERIQVWIE